MENEELLHAEYDESKHKRDAQGRFTSKNVQDVTNQTSGLFTKIASAIPKREPKTIRPKYRELTDDELRQRINRLDLERKYSDLSGDTKTVKAGSEKTREMLQTTGALVGVVGSIVAIVATIIEAKKN